MVGVQAQLTEKPLTKFFSKSNLFNRSGSMFLFQRNCIFLWEPKNLIFAKNGGLDHLKLCLIYTVWPQSSLLAYTKNAQVCRMLGQKLKLKIHGEKLKTFPS